MSEAAPSKYKRLSINTALFAANAVATKLVTFLLVPLYTAFMTAEEYGVTDMSLTVITLVTPLVTLSAIDAAVRFIIGDRAKGSEYAATGFFITLGSVALVALFTPVLDLEIFGGLGDYKGWFVLAYASSALMQLFGGVARGIGEIKLVPICASVSSLVTCALAVLLVGGAKMATVGYFISVSSGPTAAIVIYVAIGGMGSFVLNGARLLFGPSGRVERIKKLCVPMFRYSLPLIPNSLFWWVGTSISRFFITGMIGISASGIFAAASKVPNLLSVAYSIFQQAWQLSAFQDAQDGDVSKFFSSVFRVLQAGVTILCAIISLCAPFIASLFLQGDFYEAWPMISILLISSLANVFNSFYGTVYTTTMHTECIMKTTAVGAAACIVLTPMLIFALGVYGACVASAASNMLVLVVRVIDSRKYIQFDAKWSLLTPTIALLIIQSVVTAMQISGWSIISMICLICCVLLQGRNLYPMLKRILKR